MDDEVVRIVVGLCLGVALCVPHCCPHCGSDVDEMGTHGLSCRFSKGCHFRHAAINDTIKRWINAAKITCLLEPNGRYRSHGKRPDGVTMVPWSGCKVLVWDATCLDTLAPSYCTKIIILILVFCFYCTYCITVYIFFELIVLLYIIIHPNTAASSQGFQTLAHQSYPSGIQD